MRKSVLGLVAAAALLLVGSAYAADMSQATSASSGRTELAQASRDSTARVRVKSAVLRARPDARSRKVESLRRGTRLQVIESAGEWTHVRVHNRDGFVMTGLLTN